VKELFVPKSFSRDSAKKIAVVNEILEGYEAEGYRLTLRQLYYQLVSRGHVENSVKSYKRIGALVSDARLAGMVDWEMIEDRGRTIKSPVCWNNPAEIVDAAERGFAIDKWEDQDSYAEVMVEKDALSGVLWPVCSRLNISFMANKGYSSSSAMYEAGARLQGKMDQGKKVSIFYLGDHDPSGIDMTRDVEERLSLFSRDTVGVVRLALNLDQVRALNPPENPAKETDSRARRYISEFGHSSWELDAVEPKQLDRLVTAAVTGLLDKKRWKEAVRREAEMKSELEEFVKNYKGGKR
jgi:hypothetical protein